MLNIKRLTTLILTLTVLALSIFAFTACGDSTNSDSTKFGADDTMKIVLAAEEGKEIETDAKLNGLNKDCNLTDVFDANGIEYTMSGTLLESVEDMSNDTSSNPKRSLYLYTSVAADASTWAGATIIDFNGTKLYESGEGVLSMTIEKDCIIYIGYTYYTKTEAAA